MSKRTELEERYARLFKSGKLVQIHVGKWSMACKLKATDLGMKEEDLPKFMKLGNKMLIKGEVHSKFCAVEGKARNYLKANSHSFPIAQAHFVPTQRLVSVIETLNELKTEYETLTEEFITNYETYKEEMLTSFHAHRHLLEPFYPTAERARAKFLFDLSIFEISLPKELKETDLATLKAEEAAVAELQKKYEAEMEGQYLKGVSMIDTFLQETVFKLRGQIVEVFETIADKIKNREVITKTNLSSMKNIIDSFRGLDFLDDEIIKTKLDEVDSMVNSNIDFKEDFRAIDRLGVAINDVLTSANDISDVNKVTGRYYRKIDLE